MPYKLFFSTLLFLSPALHADSKLTVLTEDYPPFQYLTSEGKLAGTSFLIVDEVLKNTSFDYQIQIMPWARAYKNVTELPNTLIFSMLQTPERIEQFKWLVPLCKVTMSFYTLLERDDVSINTFDDIFAYKIGVEREQATKAFLIKKGLQKNIVEVNHNDQLREMMKYKRTDVILISDSYAKELKNTPSIINNQLRHLFTIDELNQTLFLAANINTSDKIVNTIKKSYQQLKIAKPRQCP
ncbi:substrate-binding periplasmic protein [Colwelliaceae bacterium 6441]